MLKYRLKVALGMVVGWFLLKPFLPGWGAPPQDSQTAHYPTRWPTAGEMIHMPEYHPTGFDFYPGERSLSGITVSGSPVHTNWMLVDGENWPLFSG